MSADSSIAVSKKSRSSDWAEFSLTPQKEQDIEDRLLSNWSSVCVTYICRYSSLSDKFIERLLALTTGILNAQNSEDEIQSLTDFMVNKLISKDEDKNRTIELISYEKDERGISKAEPVIYTESDLNDRLDWVYIARFQALSNDFIMKFADYLDFKDLYANERVDNDFVLSYAPHLKGYNQKLVDDLSNN